MRPQNVSFSVKINADAAEQEILDLIRHTDQVAEIPNSLRFGTDVKLSAAKVTSGKPK